MNTSKTLFFHPLLLSRIASVAIFGIRNQLVLLKNKSLNSSDQVLMVQLINVHNPHGVKLLTRLWVGLSHLRKHKFRHNFQDSVDPICNFGRHIEAIIHFFLHCSNYSNQNQICNIKSSLLDQNDWIIVGILLFRSNGLNDEENALIIESTTEYIEYIITTERFIAPLLWIHLNKSPRLLRSLIDSGSPYVILFSCLVVQSCICI